MKLLTILLLSAVCSGCTSIKITGSDDAVRIERSFGFASINLPSDTEAITAKMTTLGYIASPLGYNVGYSQQMITALNEKCRIIIWVDEGENLQDLKEQIKLVDSVCLIEEVK